MSFPLYVYGPTVPYRMVNTGRSPSEVVERLGVRDCPTCRADWTRPGALRVGHCGQWEYLCWACMTVHRGQLVDDHGRPLSMAGWGLARQQRCGDSGANA